MTNRDKLFIKHYGKCRDAKKAAILAGFSEKSAKVSGHRLLTKYNHEIQLEIQKQANRIDVEIDKIVQELALIGFSDIRNYIEFEDGGGIRIKSLDEMPEFATRAIESIQEDRVIKEDAKGETTIIHDKIKFKLHSKIKSLELLGKYKNMFIENIHLKGELQHKHEVSMKNIIQNMNDT